MSDGPFRFVSWQHGDRIVAHREPALLRGAAGTRSASTIDFVPDENTAINLLRTHAIDYIFQPSINTYPALERSPDARIVWVNANAFRRLRIQSLALRPRRSARSPRHRRTQSTSRAHAAG